MQKPSTLVFFTRAFPNHEVAEVSFVTPELAELGAVFDRVVVVPASGATAVHPLPWDNVSVDQSCSRVVHPTTMPSRFGFAARGMATAPFWEAIARCPGVLTNPRMLTRLLYCAAAASRAGAWLERWLIDQRIDHQRTLIYTFWLDHITAGLARARHWFPGLRIVSRAHGTDVYEDRHPLSLLPLRDRAVSAAGRVFTASDAARRHLGKRYPEYQDIFETAPLGVPDPGFAATPSSDGAFRVVSCAHLNPIKRTDRLIDALALLRVDEVGRRVEWRHIGGGVQQLEIERRAAARLEGNVLWTISGPLKHSDVLESYRTRPVDLFVSVSASEGGRPMSIKEAQSLSIPVLATAVGGVPEVVNEGNGWLLRPDASAEEIALAIERAISEHPNSERRRAARDHWQSFHDSARVSADFARRLLSEADR